MRVGTQFCMRAMGISVLAMAGCGSGLDLSGISGETSLADALSQLAEQVSTDPMLSQLTVSDVVAGFEQYASDLSGEAGLPLSTAQQAELAELQAQLDDGTLTLAQFTEQVESLIAEMVPPGHGRGRVGGPFRGGKGVPMSDELGLTEDQQAQAEEIFHQLHDDIDTLRKAAHEEITAVLTAEQLTELEKLQAKRPPHGRGHGPGPGDPLTQLADELALTDDQIAAIDEIRTALQEEVKAQHEQARTAFRAILNADQLTILDEIEASAPPPPAE